jgi:TPR repeat protein
MKTSAIQILVAAMVLIAGGCNNRSKTDSVTEENKDTAQAESQYATPQSVLKEPKRTDEITEEEIFEKASTGDEHSTSFLLNKIRLENDPKKLSGMAKYLVESAERGNSEAQIEISSLIKIGKISWEKPSEIFVKYKQESDKGNLNSMVLMSQLLRAGTGSEANDEQATKLLEKAALEGHLVSQYLYGRALLNGDGVKKSNSDGAKWILKAAEAGLGEAEAEVSHLYRSGCGVERDPDRALYFAKKSYEKNKIAGFESLSIIYLTGCGVDKDEGKALTLALESLKRGSPSAAAAMAGVYANKEDWNNAFKYAEVGSKENDNHAIALLGIFYDLGLGTKQDHEKAEKKLNIASEKGNSLAKFYIATKKFNKGDKKGAYQLIVDSAEEKNSNALALLGAYYHQGLSPVKKDFKKAFSLYQEAADLGSNNGKVNLAELYMAGMGTHKNSQRGFELFQEVAKDGDANGFIGLGKCYLKGEGTVKNEAEALVQYYLANAYGGENIKEIIGFLEGRLSPQSIVLCQQKAEQIFLKQKYEREEGLKRGSASNAPESGDPSRKLPEPAGSGILISNDGLIITAYHVIENAKGVAVKTSKGAFNVRVLAADKPNDLVLLQIKDSKGEFTAAPLAPSAKVKLGQTVFTLGFPNSALQGFNVKMTKGEISSTSGIQDDPRQFQISVPVQPGNSGGALFDEHGNVVGIVVAKLNEKVAKKFTGDSPQNVNYAVKSSYVFPLVEQTDSKPLTQREQTPPSKLEDIVDRIKDACVMVLVEE